MGEIMALSVPTGESGKSRETEQGNSVFYKVISKTEQMVGEKTLLADSEDCHWKMTLQRAYIPHTVLLICIGPLRVQAWLGLLFNPEHGGSRFLRNTDIIYHNIQHHIPTESDLHSHCHDNLKSHIL
jgi:hypothetical protein